MNRSSTRNGSFFAWTFVLAVALATALVPALFADDGPGCHGKMAMQGQGESMQGMQGGCCGGGSGETAGCCGQAMAMTGTGGCCGQGAEGAEVEAGCCGQGAQAGDGGCCGQGSGGGCQHGGMGKMAGKAEGAEVGGCCQGGGMGMGAMAGEMADVDGDAPSVRGCMVGGQCAMRTAMGLVHQRQGIERTVEEIPGGVRTVTTAASPELAEQIERHVREVSALLEGGGQMRMWDPLFATIFQNRDRIELRYEPIENGVVVTETSEDPWIAEVIRAHARKVNDFLARGPAAVHEPTAVPAKPSADAGPSGAALEGEAP